MKASHTILGAAALVMLCATAFVHAQTTTREQVKAETKAAKAAGTMPAVGNANTVNPETPSGKSRAEVKAETKAARKRGEIAPSGEASPVDPSAKTGAAPRKRSEVKAEAASAAKARKNSSSEKS